MRWASRREDVRPLPGAQRCAGSERARWSLRARPCGRRAPPSAGIAFTAGRQQEGDGRGADGTVPCWKRASAEEEAEAVALILREAVETPGRTATLVTPDRALARRVAARLEVWGMHVEDSAGLPFGKTLLGAFLDLVVEAAEKQFEPVALMTLLKHPLCRARHGGWRYAPGDRTLELAAFRSPYFGKGLEGWRRRWSGAEACATASAGIAAVRRLKDADWQAARDLLQRLAASFRAPREGLRTRPSLRACTTSRDCTSQPPRRLPKRATTMTASALRQGEAGEWAVAVLCQPASTRAMPAPDMAAADYPDFYRTLVAEKSIRSRRPTHPRISICDPFESRLQQSDVVILGSLNEGTWPQAADPGPVAQPADARSRWGWRRPRSASATAAHDLRVAARRAARVAHARSQGRRRADGALALAAAAAGSGQAGSGWSSKPSSPGSRGRRPATRSAVRCSPCARPSRARPWRIARASSASPTIETWIANPYAIFAERILRLEPLPLLGERPGPALRGQIVHEALGRFAQRFPETAAQGHRQGADGDLARPCLPTTPATRAWRRSGRRGFARFAAWFAETEPARRAGMTQDRARGRRQDGAGGSGRAVHAEGAGRPHRRRRRRPRHHRLQERRRACNDLASKAASRARRRSFRWRRPSRRPAVLPACRPDA